MIAKKEIMVLGSGISGIGSVMLAKKMDIDVFLSENNIIDEDTTVSYTHLTLPTRIFV